MKINKNNTHKVIDSYAIRKQLHGRFKIVEIFHYERNGTPVSEIYKRSIKKNLLLTDAENILYSLEKKL